MKRATHHRFQTSGSINLPMIATKCLQHPVTKQILFTKSIAKLQTLLPLPKKSVNNSTVPSIPSTATVSRRSSQFSSKQKPFFVKRKESGIIENKIILNIGSVKKRPSVCQSDNKSKQPKQTVQLAKQQKKNNLQNFKKQKNEIENKKPIEDNENEAPEFQLKMTTNKLKHPALEFLFDKDQQNTLDARLAKPYHLDGDLGMYTKEALEERKNFKTNQNIQTAIHRFMDDCFEFDKNHQLSKINYLAAFFKISLILRNDLSHERPEDYAEIKAIMEEDWQRDSKGRNKITREQLFISLFELADVWVRLILSIYFILDTWN